MTGRSFARSFPALLAFLILGSGALADYYARKLADLHDRRERARALLIEARNLLGGSLPEHVPAEVVPVPSVMVSSRARRFRKGTRHVA